MEWNPYFKKNILIPTWELEQKSSKERNSAAEGTKKKGDPNCQNILKDLFRMHFTASNCQTSTEFPMNETFFNFFGGMKSIVADLQPRLHSEYFAWWVVSWMQCSKGTKKVPCNSFENRNKLKKQQELN